MLRRGKNLRLRVPLRVLQITRAPVSRARSAREPLLLPTNGRRYHALENQDSRSS